MFFTYTSILSLFAFAGLVVSIWAGIRVLRARETKQWVPVMATIQHKNSDKSTLPIISYHYTVDNKDYQQTVMISDNTESMPGQTHPQLLKYPADQVLNVFYNPQQPDVTSLNRGAAIEDLIVFWIGISTLLLGLYTLI